MCESLDADFRTHQQLCRMFSRWFKIRFRPQMQKTWTLLKLSHFHACAVVSSNFARWSSFWEESTNGLRKNLLNAIGSYVTWQTLDDGWTNLLMLAKPKRQSQTSFLLRAHESSRCTSSNFGFRWRGHNWSWWHERTWETWLWHQTFSNFKSFQRIRYL